LVGKLIDDDELHDFFCGRIRVAMAECHTELLNAEKENAKQAQAKTPQK